MTCPTCNLFVSPVKIGRTSTCPGCGRVLVVENRTAEDKLSALAADLTECLERKNLEIAWLKRAVEYAHEALLWNGLKTDAAKTRKIAEGKD